MNGYGEQKDEVVLLYLDDIIPNRFQPREVFDEKALKELAVSIKEHGVIQPIIVRNVNGKYEIIAGERRYKASALAGLTKIPAIIRNLDDKESSKVALLENLQRKNLNPIEEARTYQKILELDEMTQEELAKTMGKSQSAVANKIRLLALSDEIQEALLKEQISERHARALLNVTDTLVQKELLKKIIDTKMSVRALEEEIKTLYPKGKDASEIPIDINPGASIGGLLDANPLTPTAQVIEEETSNYGKVIIAPPQEGPINPQEEKEEIKEETDMPTAPITNFGEIGKQELPENVGLNGMTIPTITPGINVDTIKENSQDINNTSSGTALDNMLNINIPSQPTMDTENKNEEYFSLPDLSGMTAVAPTVLPTQSIAETGPIFPSIVVKERTSEEEAIEKIKSVVNELQQKGISIHIDEMNFPTSCQIIIKIDKSSEEKVS